MGSITRTASSLVVLALTTSSMAACGAHDPPPPTGSRSSAIINGRTSGPEEDAAVLLMMYAGEELSQRCTGTLVAPNLVVTARHCTSETTEESIVCSADGQPRVGGGGTYEKDRDVSSMFVYTGTDAAGPAAERAPPDARGERLVYDESVKNICGGDLAFIVLDRPITKIAPARIRLDENARVGETLRVAGYGLTEQGTVSAQRLSRTTSVIAVGPSEQEQLSPREYATGEGDCRGDSGGPAFDEAGALVGVLSRGGGGTKRSDNASDGCVGPGATNVRTSLYAMRSLVERAFLVSGNALDESDVPVGDDPPIKIEDAYPEITPEEKERTTRVPPPPFVEETRSSGCGVSPAASAASDGLIALLAATLLAWMFRSSSRRRRGGRRH